MYGEGNPLLRGGAVRNGLVVGCGPAAWLSKRRGLTSAPVTGHQGGG